MFANFIRLICLLSVIFECASSFATEKSILPIKTWKTKVGTPVFYVYEPELPMIDIQVAFDAGSARDGNQAGIAKLTNESLSVGTTTQSVDAIAAAFENVGAIYSNAINRDMAVVALRSLSDPHAFQPALATFTEVLTKANFPSHEFSRVQKQLLRTLEEQEELPASIALKSFYHALYDNLPYGHPISGYLNTVNLLAAKDSLKFYQQFYTAQNCLIAIVGDIDESNAHLIAENLSKNMQQGKKIPMFATKKMNSGAIKKHISFPSSQTNVLMGQIGITRSDPDYYTVVVGNYILGGGSLTSRLFDEVREKRGLAYTVRSQFNALKERGPFLIELQTRNSEAKNAINVVSHTLNNFISNGPTNQELAGAKENLAHGFVLKLASNSAIISQLLNIGFYHLSLDYLDTYADNINKVTDQSIKQVFNRIIHPNNLVTITVGKEMNEQEAGTKT